MVSIIAQPPKAIQVDAPASQALTEKLALAGKRDVVIAGPGDYLKVVGVRGDLAIVAYDAKASTVYGAHLPQPWTHSLRYFMSHVPEERTQELQYHTAGVQAAPTRMISRARNPLEEMRVTHERAHQTVRGLNAEYKIPWTNIHRHDAAGSVKLRGVEEVVMRADPISGKVTVVEVMRDNAFV